MADIGEERRRSPRFVVQDHVSLAVQDQARVLDIGTGGVLMAVQDCPPDGLVLRLALRGAQFSAGLRVRHQAPAGEEIRIGAAFVDMSAQSREALESFLRHATPRKHQVQES
jgi:hypothetical protein